MVKWPSINHKHHRFLKEIVFGIAGENVVPDLEEDRVLSPQRGVQVTVRCAKTLIQVLMETYDTQDGPSFIF